MTELRDEGIAAFIGPDYSCKNEALVAGAWNLPMIAFVRNDSTRTTGLILKKKHYIARIGMTI